MQSDNVGKVAIIGAGGVAKSLLKYVKIDKFDLYTSTGEGELCGVIAHRLSSLAESNYSSIYIAIQRYGEIIPKLSGIEKGEAKYYWFDVKTNTLVTLTDKFGDSFVANDFEGKDGLTVIYDLRVAPLTYDFAIFLGDCELERQQRGLKYINVILAPGDEGGIKRGQTEHVKQMELRMQGIIFPITNQFSSPVFLKHCASRKEAREMWEGNKHRHPLEHNFLDPPRNYLFSNLVSRVRKGQSLDVLKGPGDLYLSFVNNWAGSLNLELSKLITITLRESQIQPGRNSNVSEWIKFARKIEKRGYEVVFIRDTEKAFCVDGLLDEFHVFTLASFDLNVRRALYESSFINLMVSNGVCVLGMLDHSIRYIFFRMLNEEYGATSSSYFNLIGVNIGENFADARPWQKLCWQNDDAEIIENEFLTLEKVINDNA